MNSENLLRQAMRNSGIVIERVTMEEMQMPDEPAVAATEEIENEVVEAEEELCEEQCVEVEQVELVCLYSINRFNFLIFLACTWLLNSTVSLTTPHAILSASLPVLGSLCQFLQLRFSRML